MRRVCCEKYSPGRQLGEQLDLGCSSAENRAQLRLQSTTTFRPLKNHHAWQDSWTFPVVALCPTFGEVLSLGEMNRNALDKKRTGQASLGLPVQCIRAGESSRTLLTHASCGKSDRLRNVKAEGSLPVRRELLEDGRRDLLVRFLPGRHKTARASLRERS